MENDRTYFMRRAAQERSAADHAADGKARDAHLELARRYRDLVGGAAARHTIDQTSAPTES
jgi:hypothetical protein